MTAIVRRTAADPLAAAKLIVAAQLHRAADALDKSASTSTVRSNPDRVSKCGCMCPTWADHAEAQTIAAEQLRHLARQAAS